MIDKHEIRIGNIIKNGDDGEFFIVSEISIFDVGCFHISNRNIKLPMMNYECYNPILLTPEILETCGFEKKDYYGREQWLGPWISRVQPLTKYRVGVMKDDFGFVYENSPLNVRLPHLHNFQNWYYILTGKELELNLINT